MKWELLGHLSPAQRKKLEHASLFKEYAGGEILFYEGEESRFFHLLMEGEVSVFKSSASTGTIVVHRFYAPSFVAEVATLKQIPYPASAEAVGGCKVLKIEREAFLALLQEDPSFTIALIASLTQKIAALESSLRRHSAPNASAKVARLILDDPDAFTRMKGVEVAALLGLSPETLSRILKKFRELPVIASGRSQPIRVVDAETLTRIADNNFPLR